MRNQPGHKHLALFFVPSNWMLAIELLCQHPNPIGHSLLNQCAFAPTHTLPPAIQTRSHTNPTAPDSRTRHRPDPQLVGLTVLRPGPSQAPRTSGCWSAHARTQETVCLQAPNTTVTIHDMAKARQGKARPNAFLKSRSTDGSTLVRHPKLLLTSALAK